MILVGRFQSVILYKRKQERKFLSYKRAVWWAVMGQRQMCWGRDIRQRNVPDRQSRLPLILKNIAQEETKIRTHFPQYYKSTVFWHFFFLIFFFNVYLFLGQRETEHEWGRGRERGRHRIGNRLQALSCQPRAWRGARTHGPWDRDLAEVGRLTDCATQAPRYYTVLINEHGKFYN